MIEDNIIYPIIKVREGSIPPSSSYNLDQRIKELSLHKVVIIDEATDITFDLITLQQGETTIINKNGHEVTFTNSNNLIDDKDINIFTLIGANSKINLVRQAELYYTCSKTPIKIYPTAGQYLSIYSDQSFIMKTILSLNTGVTSTLDIDVNFLAEVSVIDYNVNANFNGQVYTNQSLISVKNRSNTTFTINVGSVPLVDNTNFTLQLNVRGELNG